MPILQVLLIVVLIFLVIGLLPHWPYAQGWSVGYWPSGGLTLLLVVVLVLILARGL
jgi:hypothetical protein